MYISALKIITTMVVFMAMQSGCLAADQSLTIPLTLRLESNPTFSSTDEKSVTLSSLTPSYSIFSNNLINPWRANLSVRMVRSSDQTIIQDRDDPSVNLGWTHNYETGQFVVTGLSSEQSTRVSELTDSGLVSGDNTRKTRSGSVNWLSNLNDRISFTLGGDVTNVNFEGLVTTGLVAFRNEAYNMKLDQAVSEKLNTFALLSSSHFLPKNGAANEATTNALNLGLIWNTSEQFNLNASAGLNETKYKNNSRSLEKSWQAMFSMQYSTDRTSSQLNLSRSKLPSSSGNLNEANQITAGWTYSLSEKESIILDVNCRQNLSLNKTKTSQFSAKYTRQISLSWDFSLSAEHRLRESVLGDASNNSIMTGIVYKLPEF